MVVEASCFKILPSSSFTSTIARMRWHPTYGQPHPYFNQRTTCRQSKFQQSHFWHCWRGINSSAVSGNPSSEQVGLLWLHHGHKLSSLSQSMATLKRTFKISSCTVSSFRRKENGCFVKLSDLRKLCVRKPQTGSGMSWLRHPVPANPTAPSLLGVCMRQYLPKFTKPGDPSHVLWIDLKRVQSQIKRQCVNL